MTEPVSIPRKAPSSQFDRLVKEGIKLAQKYSGKVWTDYNVHDPGRTILEHLCYALTDLIYKTGFNVEDYLCNEDGSIDHKKLGLQAPEDVLPCRPVTETDYRKILLDSIPEISNAWVSSADGEKHRGLYRILVRLGQELAETEKERLVEAVRRVYCRHRNLCEDVAQIVVAPELPCEMHACLEVAGSSDVDDVLARVYFESERCIAQGIGYRSYGAALREGRKLEELLRGPYTHKGYIDDHRLTEVASGVDLLDLVAKVGEIDGVLEVKSLFLRVNGRDYSTYLGFDQLKKEAGNETATFACLHIPTSADQVKVELKKDGRSLTSSVQKMRARYDAMRFRSEHLEKGQQVLGRQSRPPTGQYRDLQQYVSIQNDFPANFGINARGLPDSAPPEDKARAAQLKGYLLLFDQVMANFGANLQNLGKLFSPEGPESVTTWYKALDKTSVPGADALYRCSAEQALEEITRRYDNHQDRKSRLLDYLLALCGEKFTQTALRQFTNPSQGQSSPEVIIENKIRLLRHIVEVNRDRSGGDDYLKGAWGAGSIFGWKLKVRLLLGIETLQDGPLSEADQDEGLHVVEHILLRPEGKDSRATDKVKDDFFQFRASVVFPAWPARFNQPKFRHLAEETIRINCPAHIYAQCYWLKADRMAEFESLYRCWAQEKCRWRPAGSPEALDRAATALASFLVSQAEEGAS